jgi:hypothetical protein
LYVSGSGEKAFFHAGVVLSVSAEPSTIAARWDPGYFLTVVLEDKGTALLNLLAFIPGALFPRKEEQGWGPWGGWVFDPMLAKKSIDNILSTCMFDELTRVTRVTTETIIAATKETFVEYNSLRGWASTGKFGSLEAVTDLSTCWGEDINMLWVDTCVVRNPSFASRSTLS